MKQQSYASHRRLDPFFHGLLFSLVMTFLVGSFYNLYAAISNEERLWPALMLCIGGIILIMMFFYFRAFPLKAQDRAIRAEENFRHFVLTGKRLDPRLKPLQIVALRFAPDEELPELAQKAAEQGMTPDQIKREIRQWKADHHRV